MTANASEPLELRGITVALGQRTVLWDVDLTVGAGRMTAICGPNGAGKSTLLRAALGLVPLLGGQARFFGDTFPSVRRRVAYVPQRESVDWDFPIDALGVVLMGRSARLAPFRRPSRADREAARAALREVELDSLERRPIGKLSGGQQQRVFLARALCAEPDLLVMDEPFAGVDAASERAITKTFESLKASGKTLVVVHHDLKTVAEAYDDVLLLDGRAIAFGPAAETLTPENLQLAYPGPFSGAARAAPSPSAADR